MKTKENPLDEARTRVREQQKTYVNHRGRARLAEIVVDGFQTISTILKTVTAEDQALILSGYQINMATGTTSLFSPWIAAIWGEPDDTVPAIPDFDEVDHPKWKPDASMAVYFHTMETFRARGWDEATPRKDLLDFIKKEGGTQVVANKRKKELRDARAPKEQRDREALRTLYREDGPRIPLTITASDLELPSETAELFTLLVERLADGSLFYRGLVDRDGTGALDRLAKAAGPELDKKRLIDLAVERGRREERERIAEENKSANGGS